jgi:hypothetical protein
LPLGPGGDVQVLGALFPPNGRYALFVALTPALVLLIRAKDLFVAADDLHVVLPARLQGNAGQRRVKKSPDDAGA